MTNVLFTPTWCHEMGPKAHHSHLPFLYQIGPTLHEYPGTTRTSAFREPQAVKWRGSSQQEVTLVWMHVATLLRIHKDTSNK
jgi:hypothetical protein